MTSVTVLGIASGVIPLIKRSGLGEAAGVSPRGLRLALADEGVRVMTLVQGYAAVLAGTISLQNFIELFRGPARILKGCAGSFDLLASVCPVSMPGAAGARAGPC